MGRGGVTYHGLIARNRRNSAFLVIAFVLFIGLLVGVLGAGLVDAGPREAVTLAAIAAFGAIRRGTDVQNPPRPLASERVDYWN